MTGDIPPLLTKRIQEHQQKRMKRSLGKPKIAHQIAIAIYRFNRRIKNAFAHYTLRKTPLMPAIIARHQSVLLKKLGNNNEQLQLQKIKNLQIASKKIDGIVIEPGQTFSYWHTIGKPHKKDGYVEGMLLSQGKVIAGIGGGLCQVSNLLYWLFLHGPFEIVERYHHSYDVFPDSGRVLPFGSGATVFYNYVDLVVKNISSQPMQIHLWLTNNHLKGQILSTERYPKKFTITEKNHYFVHHHKQWFRYNELYQEIRNNGKLETTRLVTTNLAPVLYPVTEKELKQKGYTIQEIN